MIQGAINLLNLSIKSLMLVPIMSLYANVENITFWFSDEALASWKPERMHGRRGRPMEYSDLAIECCLMIRQVYTLPLRQTQGFIRLLIKVMDLNISAPDFSSISKRSTCGVRNRS